MKRINFINKNRWSKSTALCDILRPWQLAASVVRLTDISCYVINFNGLELFKLSHSCPKEQSCRCWGALLTSLDYASVIAHIGAVFQGPGEPGRISKDQQGLLGFQGVLMFFRFLIQALSKENCYRCSCATMHKIDTSNTNPKQKHRWDPGLDLISFRISFTSPSCNQLSKATEKMADGLKLSLGTRDNQIQHNRTGDSLCEIYHNCLLWFPLVWSI